MRKVLFVTYGGGHVNIVKPIAKEIEKHDEIDYQILALTTAIPYLKNTGLKYKTLLDYLPMLKNNKEIINIGNKLALQYHNSDAGFSIEQTSAYLGCSMYDLIEKVGEEKGYKKFEEEGRKAFCPTSIMKQILKIEKPDIVVTTVPYRMEKAAVLEAKELGIKTVFIHDLHYIQKDDLYNYVDANFVMNESVKNQLLSYAIAENKIYITGQPAFDYLLEPIYKTRENICNKINIDYKSKIIIWIVDNSIVLNDITINTVIEAIDYYKNYYFILKLHPNENNVQFFRKIASKRINVTVLKHFNNRELLEIGDAFIVGVSTMGLEISFFDKDMIVLCLNNIFSDKNISFRYDMLKIALPVLKKENLVEQIKNIFNDNTKKFLKFNRKSFWGQKSYAANKCYKFLKIISNIKEDNKCSTVKQY